MSAPVPTFKGWYPDPYTGGTKYWDGSRWTGDTRPRRKSFAAVSGFGQMGIIVIVLGLLFVVMIFMGVFGDKSMHVSALLFVPLPLVIVPAIGVYLLRGQGPTTQSVETRLAEQRKAAKGKRRAADIAGFVANIGRVLQPRPFDSPTRNDAAAAAQINAVANPETARALQNLQNLLYTQTITDTEFQAAKDKLLGTQALTDSFSQIAKLTELHQAGILGDVEFAAAKARALGL